MRPERDMSNFRSLREIVQQIDREWRDDELRRLDHAMIRFVADHQDTIGRQAAGVLVGMQRKLRRLRYEIEGKG